MGNRAALGAALAGAALALGGAAAAEEGRIYRWTDEAGVVRYTPDARRVPLSARDSLAVVEVGEPSAPEPEADVEPAAPGALPAVMGRKLPEALIAPAPLEPTDLDGRITQLREAIRRDQQELQQLVGGGEELAGADAAERDERIALIANRLPELQAELARLERLRLGAPEP